MPDTRKYLRFLPRPGKRISITIGDPITDKISPLVDEWRRLAKVGPGKLGVGGAWSGNERIEASLGAVKDAKTKVDLASSNPERRERASGQVAEGREVSVRKQICQVLTDELTAMGMRIEAREGKDKNPWRNAVRREGYEASSR
jgi:monolysocardiolipin acyltransferase